MPPSAVSHGRCASRASGRARRHAACSRRSSARTSAARRRCERRSPTYYSQAVRENDVDVIAAPEIEITAGKDEGPVTFDAVVEVRPVITVGGYQNLRVEIPRPEATDEEIDAQIDRLRDQFGELTAVDRPAIDGDHVTITIDGSRDGEDIAGLRPTTTCTRSAADRSPRSSTSTSAARRSATS